MELMKKLKQIKEILGECKTTIYLNQDNYEIVVSQKHYIDFNDILKFNKICENWEIELENITFSFSYNNTKPTGDKK